MNQKIEQLKAAFNAATPGEWRLSGCRSKTNALIEHGNEETLSPLIAEVFSHEGRLPREANVSFITLAHNLMPALLAAAELAEVVAKMMTKAEDEENGDDFGRQGDDGETLCHIRSLAVKVCANLK